MILFKIIMGNCTYREHKPQNIWSCFNSNLNLTEFIREINYDQYIAYQTFLDHVWINCEIINDTAKTKENITLRIELKDWVSK